MFKAFEQRIDSGLHSQHGKLAQEWRPHNPYRQYVHSLVQAGWSNLKHLNNYLAEEHPQETTVAILDVEHRRRWDLTESDLDSFNEPRDGVRLYLAEYSGTPSSAFIETLGSRLKLDPRFFQWAIHSKGHVFTPSQRHRAPYVSLGFGILNASTPRKTDAERFKVLVYILPDEYSWIGIILFSSRTKINISARNLTDPPEFPSTFPADLNAKSLRELYIESLDFLDRTRLNPFYTISTLLRLDCFFWNAIITTIREEDHRINGISDTTIGHAEEIKKTLDVVRRGGSLSWPKDDCQESLEEDFTHLVEQTELLWNNRSKMAAIRDRNSETKWQSLTTAFTYIFAPVTIISGIYGMNVSELSGSSSNPNIWQFFVAIAVFDVLVVVAFMIYWIQLQLKQGKKLGTDLMKGALGFAVGNVESK